MIRVIIRVIIWVMVIDRNNSFKVLVILVIIVRVRVIVRIIVIIRVIEYRRLGLI